MRKRFLLKQYFQPVSKWFNFDHTMFFIIVGLCLFGLIAVFNSSTVSAFHDFGNQYHYLREQTVFLIIGLVVMTAISLIDYHVWYQLAIPILVGCLVLLVAVFIPGIGVHALGAKRWLNFGITTLQPTEFAKISLVIYLSAWFSYKERGRFIPFLVLLSIIVGLIILQPDLGTAVIVILIALFLYFLSGASIWHFILLLPVLGLLLLGLSIVAPYRFARITTFLNPAHDPLGASYHVRQILISLGSGGWFGVGLGKSRQKYEYLPEANTDSIFAIIAEEIGFLGCAVLLLAYVILIRKMFQTAWSAPDRFGRLLGSGIVVWFAVQTMINLGSMVVLLPLTGVPLPLISYGGSSLISLLIGFGILLNISKHRLKLSKN